MPKYVFECYYCQLRFERALKMGDHLDHPCPECEEAAPRIIEGFAFQFASGGKDPANSGVHDHDYPTADKIVGRDADERKEFVHNRDLAKNDLRKQAGTNALSRLTGSNGEIEYRPLTRRSAEVRRSLADQAIRRVRESR